MVTRIMGDKLRELGDAIGERLHVPMNQRQQAESGQQDEAATLKQIDDSWPAG